MALTLSGLRPDVHNDWCPGCGAFGIEAGLKMALTELPIDINKLVLFSGIGCSGKIVHFTNATGVHTLHGRVLPFAQGAKLANPDIEVIAIGGDGDGLGIGVGHFVHAGRRNIDMTYIIHDNGVYGLTKGQASPTLQLGMQTKSLPMPNINTSGNPILLAIAAGFTIICPPYSSTSRQLKHNGKERVPHPSNRRSPHQAATAKSSLRTTGRPATRQDKRDIARKPSKPSQRTRIRETRGSLEGQGQAFCAMSS